MTAPTPVPGANPYVGAYQTKQFDQGLASEAPHGYEGHTVFGALATPPAAGVNASSSPDKLYLENTDPPVGAGGNENGAEIF